MSKSKPLDIEDYTTKFTETTKKSDYVRFVFISDTHGKAQKLELPPGDVLVHCGDFTNVCSHKEIVTFDEYLASVKKDFKYIIVICGNHEKKFDPKHYSKATESREKLQSCIYLEDEIVNILGFNIYGTPWQPEYRINGAFSLPHGNKRATEEKWNQIPSDTDILVSHGPPYLIGDECKSGLHVGCPVLLSTVKERVKPLVHAFGHIHEAYGIWSDDTTIFINASSCNRRIEIVNRPIVIDLKVPERQLQYQSS